MSESSGIFNQGNLTEEAAIILLKIGQLEETSNNIQPEDIRIETGLKHLGLPALSEAEVAEKIMLLADVGYVACSNSCRRRGQTKKEIKIISLTMEGLKRIDTIKDEKNANETDKSASFFYKQVLIAP